MNSEPNILVVKLEDLNDDQNQPFEVGQFVDENVNEVVKIEDVNENHTEFHVVHDMTDDLQLSFPQSHSFNHDENVGDESSDDEENVNISKLLIKQGHFEDGSSKASNTADQSFECFICRARFPSLVKLTNHTQVHFQKSKHSGNISLHCKICNVRFITPNSFTLHCKLKHADSDDKHRKLKHAILEMEDKLKCKVCAKRFKYLSQLKLHQVVHSNEKSYQCDKCKTRFKHYSSIQAHRRRLYCHLNRFK